MSLVTALNQQLPWPLTIAYQPSIDSTSLAARRDVVAGRALPFLRLASAQTAGIGRHGHQFDSPADAGLYFTYAFPRPSLEPALITPAAGVALQQAISQTLGLAPQIKWVNDLLVNDAKVAGILTEYCPTPHPTMLVGVGVNLAPSPLRHALPDAQPIGALLAAMPAPAVQARLIAQWLTRFTALLAQPAEIMPAYRQRAAWLGRTVWLTGAGRPCRGTIVGFDDHGALQLRTATGLVTTSTGSIRRPA